MDTYTEIITKSSGETAQLGKELASSLIRKGDSPSPGSEARGNNARVACLYGELGSGKTTFVQGFASGLGITDRLLSPTFLIVRRYQLPAENGFLYHLDLYRIDTEKDLEGIGLYELFTDPSSWILVEWAEKLGSLLPKDRIDIHFEALEDGKHRIRMNIKS